MKLKQLGERNLIKKIRGKFLSRQRSFLGIGDDCAILPFQKNQSYLYTTDLMIEDIHFLHAKMPAHAVGFKALARSLSDIAAMGGKAKYAVLAMALPKNLSYAWIEDFLRGFTTLAKKSGVTLMGGDTSSTQKKLFFDVGVLGVAENKKIKLRSHAKAGDYICVTGNLGDSAAGLQCLRKKRRDQSAKILIERHFYPKAQLESGFWLGSRDAVHAMTDISDGISADLSNICKESKCGAEVFLERLPFSKELKKTFPNEYKRFDLAVNGGEDYQLLFTVAKSALPKIAATYKKRFKKDFYVIGQITKQNKIEYFYQGRAVVFSHRGFSHF